MAEPHRDEIAKLEALYSDNPEGRVFTLLAEAYRKSGELDRAREVLEHGLKRHSEYASAYVVLGRVLLDLREGDDAVAAFSRVLQLDPENLVALRALGDRARTMGQTADALRYYRELQHLDPSDEELQETVSSLEKDLASAPPAPPPGAAPAASWGSSSVLNDVTPSEPGFGDVSIDTSGASSSFEAPGGTGDFGNISFSSDPGADEMTFSSESLNFGGDAGSQGGSAGFGGMSLTPDAGTFSLDPAPDVGGPLDLGGPSDTGLPGFDEPAADLPLYGDLEAAAEDATYTGFEAQPVDTPSSYPGLDESPADTTPYAPPAERSPYAPPEAPDDTAFPGLPAFEEAEPDLPFHGGDPLGDAAASHTGQAGEPVGAPDASAEPGFRDGALPFEIEDIAPDAAANAPADDFPFGSDEPEPESWSGAPEPEDPGALDAAAAGAEPWVLEDEASVGGEVVTETMAELYTSQGLNERAAEVYRTLLAEKPGDPSLIGKLHEAETAAAADLAAVDVAETAATAWTDANTAQAAPEALYAWTGDGTADAADDSPPVAEYFVSLLAWRPSQPAKRPPAGRGTHVPTPAPAAPPAAVQPPAAAEPAPAPAPAPVPQATPPEAAAPAKPAEAEDDLAWLYDDEPAQPATAAAPPALPKAAPAKPAVAPPAGAGAPEGEDDDDLDMFRSWLQSLKR